MASFSNKKELRFVITLAPGQGTFGSSNQNQITLEGFRATVDIDKGGGAMYGTLHANIYGVSASHMNAITTIAYQSGFISTNTIEWDTRSRTTCRHL
jgi:hypothetical protein